MKLETRPLELKLTTPFRISRGTQTHAHNIIVRLENEDFHSFGEAAPSTYYGETNETVVACLHLFTSKLGTDSFAIEDILNGLDKCIKRNMAAKAAVDIALHDLVGKVLGIPLYQFFGLTARTPLNSYTLGLDSPAEMAKKALIAKDHPILKIKLGTKHDLAIIKNIRDVSEATLRVDANGAWTPKEAIRIINAIAPYRIELVEQPVSPSDIEGLKLVRDNVTIPIFADESCVTIEDIPRLAGYVDGINIKLMKCGGLRNALKMIHTARALKMQVMIGCMIESSLAITAAAHLAPLVDYTDLDGNLLIENDPYEGVRVENGRLILPNRPGIGISVRGNGKNGIDKVLGEKAPPLLGEPR